MFIAHKNKDGSWLIENLKTEIKLTQLLEHADKQGYVYRCPFCGNEDIKECNMTFIQYTPAEYDIYCPICDNFIGFYAYGHNQTLEDCYA